jgi:hypothetical protein
VLGECVSGVVAGGDQGRREQLPDAQGVARKEPDVAVEGGREGCGVTRDGHLVFEANLARLDLPQGHERDHDLVRRAHREPFGGVLSGEVLATLGVRQHPRARPHPRLGKGARRRYALQHQDERE